MENLISYFQNMKTEEMVLFITIALSLIVLIIMSVSLASKNAELRKIIIKMSKEKEQTKKENKYTFDSDKETIQVEKANKEVEKIEDPEIQEEKRENKQHFVLGREPISTEKKLENTGLYAKNILNEVGTKDQTSPIVIGKKVYPDDIKLEEEPVQKLKPIEILEEEEDETFSFEEEEYEEERSPRSFVEEISKQIEKDLEPQTIDLTEFERRQEEDAVISYEELIKNKQRSSRYIDEEELLNEEEDTYQLDTDDDDEFLKELKSFRSDL